jgi:hypothetical protein|tara:strand:+ start:1748 stop:2125 length:378 start_codon:yes stop_codon:yes gene_type:complete
MDVTKLQELIKELDEDATAELFKTVKNRSVTAPSTKAIPLYSSNDFLYHEGLDELVTAQVNLDKLTPYYRAHNPKDGPWHPKTIAIESAETYRVVVFHYSHNGTNFHMCDPVDTDIYTRVRITRQ